MALQLSTAGINIPRDNHWEVPNGTDVPVRTLLLEPEMDNIAFSNDFSNATYIKSQLTPSLTSVVAPDGTETAWLLTESTSVSSHYLHRNSTHGSNQNWGFSVFVKAGTRSRVQFLLDNSGNPGAYGYGRVYVNLTTGTIMTTQTSGAIITSTRITALDNGWYRIEAYWRVPAIGVQRVFMFLGIEGGTSMEVDGASYTYDGDGTSGLYVWGWQDDAGNAQIQSTSFIPTTTATVTRTQDLISFPFTEPPQTLTIYARFIVRAFTGTEHNQIVSLGDFVLSGNRVYLALDGSNLNGGFRRAGVQVVSDSSTVVAVGDNVEAVVQYSAEDGTVFLQYCINEGDILDGVISTPNGAVPSTWSGNVIVLNGNDSADINSSFAYRNVIVSPDLKTLVEMREIAGISVA